MGANERFDPRTPPHSSEAEQSVIGCVLQDNVALEAVGDRLRAEHFYHPAFAAVWHTITRLVAAAQPADAITVAEAGGHDHALIAALETTVPSARHAAQYAGIVLERWRERKLYSIATALADEVRGGIVAPGGTAAVIDRAVTTLLALQGGALDAEPQLIGALLPQFCEELEDRASGKTTALPTGLVDLDHLCSGGARPGELWVIGARPSMGKTALTLTVSRNTSADHAVLMLTQEDSAQSYVQRHVAREARVNLSGIRAPMSAPQSMWASISTAVDALAPLRLYIDDQAALTLADIRRKVQQVKRRDAGLRMVIVDYLQLMSGEGDNRNLELGRIANGLKKAAKDFGITIVLLSQLNREADKRSGVPQMADLRDSGDIEGAADVIALLHRHWQRKPMDEYKHWAQLHVAKQKNGPTGTLNLYFDGETQRFDNFDGPAPRVA